MSGKPLPPLLECYSLAVRMLGVEQMRRRSPAENSALVSGPSPDVPRKIFKNLKYSKRWVVVTGRAGTISCATRRDGGERRSLIDAQRPDSLAGAGGLEPPHR